MSNDDLVSALNALADAIRRASAADQDRHEELLQAIKYQSDNLASIDLNTGQSGIIQQTLQDCESHLRDLAERLAPAPDYD